MASNKEIAQLEQNMENKIRELASGERSSRANRSADRSLQQTMDELMEPRCSGTEPSPGWW
jgi:hypothetical protein